MATSLSKKFFNPKFKNEIHENAIQTGRALFKLNSEDSKIMGSERSFSKAKWDLYEILNKIKESLYSSVVQVVQANYPDPPNPYWMNIVTGVACLTETSENKYFVRVSLESIDLFSINFNIK